MQAGPPDTSPSTVFAIAPDRQASSAYREAGAETDVGAASPHAMVAMLFAGYFDALAHARGALLAQRAEDKGRAIGRAVRIVEEGLKAALDAGQGGVLAANLKDLYSYVTLRLSEANLYNDAAALEECERLMAPIHSAWQAIAPRGNLHVEAS